VRQEPALDAPDQGGTLDPLGFDSRRFRELGHLLVDRVVDHWEALDAGPAIREAAPSELTALGGPLPAQPGDADRLLELLIREGFGAMQHAAHPRFFARVPSPASFTGILGDWIASGHNGVASSWAGGSGPSAIELTVIDWLRSIVGFPKGSEGILVSGGSLGNLTALAAARTAGYDGTVYLSDQTHASVARALRILGIPGQKLRIVPASERFRWSSRALAAAIDRADRGRGMVVATAGTTNTGAVDPLAAIAELCRERDLWLHVDGAYGAPAALSPATRRSLEGLELADSLALDPHKWLFQPYGIGCVLVSRPGVLEACFSMNPEYLRDVQSTGAGEVDLRNRGPELSRQARAARLWLTFAVHGSNALRAAIERSIALAEEAQAILEADPRFEIVTPAQLAILTFRDRALPDAEHERRARALTAGGYAAVSCTLLERRTVYRLCLINPRTTIGDVIETIARLKR
jgi:aromatic-L-amino-acid decarboxylase